MTHKSKITCLFEYALLRIACAIVNAIPYRLACFLAHKVAFLAFDVLRFRRQSTLERIGSVFPEKSNREVVAIARFSLANVLIDAIEMIRAGRLNRDWMDQHVKDGPIYAARLRELIDEGHGVVIMVPHCGNWYMAAWAMARYGVPLFAIAAKQRNPYVDAWMNRQYGDELEVLERGNAKTLRLIREKLASGRAFAILPDLRSPVVDVETDFLNGKANVSHGGAMFAVDAGCPIVVAVMRREHGIHVFDHIATLRPDANAPNRRDEAKRLTREVMRLIGEAVLKTPEQWFWFNKRWILQPVKKTRFKG